MQHRIIYLALGVIGIALIVIFAMNNTKEPASNNKDKEQQVREVVQEFGSRMKNVSLLAPTVKEDIRAQYEEYVSPEIMTYWQENPLNAPGRRSSSPWPDRIEIQEVTRLEDGAYDVQGVVIEITSTEEATGGAASQYQIALKLREVSGAWIITGYQSLAPIVE